MNLLCRCVVTWLGMVGSLLAMVAATIWLHTPTLLRNAPPATALQFPGARRRTRPSPKMPVQFAAKRLSKELQKVCDTSPQLLRLLLSSLPALFLTRALTQPAAQISNSLPPGIQLVSAENLEEWLLDIQVLDNNPLYLNETYRLKFRFSATYPIGN